MAWKASADDSGSAFDDEEKLATASAGRHTDREAADTAATAQLPGADENAPAPPAATPSDEVASSRSEPAGGSVQKAHRSGSGRGAVAERAAPANREERKLESEAGGGVPPAAVQAAAPTLPPAGLVAGKLTVKGALTADQVSPRLADLTRACRSSVTGTLVLHIEIDGKGAVVDVRLIGSSKVVAPLSTCLSTAARALAFPPASGTTTVERELTVR
jgi:hypothetical protein